MTCLTETDLDAIRTDLAAAAIGGASVFVLNPTQGEDDAEGRAVITYPDTEDLEPVPARLWQTTASELRDDRWVTVERWRLRVALDVEITKGARIATGGIVFEVVSAAPVSGALGSLWTECDLLLVEGSVL